MNATQNIPADMVAIFKTEIAATKEMALVAFAIEDRAYVVRRWRDLCDTLASIGSSVVQIEAL